MHLLIDNFLETETHYFHNEDLQPFFCQNFEFVVNLYSLDLSV